MATQAPLSPYPPPAKPGHPPQPGRRRLAALAIGVSLALLGHRWIALGWSAARYPTATASDRTQVVVSGERAYVAAGAAGFEVVDLSRRNRPLRVPPQPPANRVDDLALAGGWLFALDATSPGNLMMYSLARPELPAPSSLVPVPVGPFSGVSAAAGLVAVSGGTSRLTLREYDSEGHLGTEVATADFGRGQPDIALRPDGRMAAISTHLYGPEFAITFASIERHPLRVRGLGQVRLRAAGFTEGGYKPAHFPLVAAWRGDRLYVAEGGGLSVIDASDPAAPRLLVRKAGPAPAMDLALAEGELDVLRAGPAPALFRFRLDASSGLPRFAGRRSLPSGSLPAALARRGPEALISRRGGDLLVVPLQPAFDRPFRPTLNHHPQGETP